jgi:hypothetical protein
MVFRRCGLPGRCHLRFREPAGEEKGGGVLAANMALPTGGLADAAALLLPGRRLLEGAQGYQESLFLRRISDIERFRSFASPRVGARRAGLLSLTLTSAETLIFT